MARILVTGAAGFIGRALCPLLAARGHAVIAGTREAVSSVGPFPGPSPGPLSAGIEPRRLGEIGPDTDWSGVFDGIDIVIHLAQRAHGKSTRDALRREARAAANLARAAAYAGAHRIVYLSSIKAMGEATPPGAAFTAEQEPGPEDAYGRAKLATELALADIASGTGIDLVVIRPPLVYGPGVGANFAALIRLAASGLPLPFAGLDNRRSLICVENLCDLIARVAGHPGISGRVLLGRDDRDWSTPALIRALAAALGREARLFRVPELGFALSRRVPGIGPPLARLTQSLAIDDGATRALLGWAPPIAAEAALTATVRAVAAKR